MAFQIQYKSLCEVAFRHGFHLNKGATEFDDLTKPEKQRRLAAFDLSKNLQLFVPPETKKTLAGLGCLLKATRTGFKIATEVKQLGEKKFQPARIPTKPFKFVLVMESRDRNFWNYTNSNLRGPQKTIYLSNRAGSSGGVFPDLALPPRPFVAENKPYPAGTVVGHDNAVFLSIREDEDNQDPPNNKKWIKLGDRKYVSDADDVTVRPFVFMLPPPAGMKKVTQVVAKNQDGDLEGAFKVTFPSPGPDVSIDASQLKSGQYQLVVTGEDDAGNIKHDVEQIYLAPDLINRNPVAIIELFHLPGNTIRETFRFYDEANGFALRRPNFKVRFLNRHTFWRYRFQTPLENSGEDDDLDKDLVTKKVMPLTRDFQEVLFRSKKLPNPSVNLVVPEKNRVFSDVQIHINP